MHICLLDFDFVVVLRSTKQMRLFEALCRYLFMLITYIEVTKHLLRLTWPNFKLFIEEFKKIIIEKRQVYNRKVYYLRDILKGNVFSVLKNRASIF